MNLLIIILQADSLKSVFYIGVIESSAQWVAAMLGLLIFLVAAVLFINLTGRKSVLNLTFNNLKKKEESAIYTSIIRRYNDINYLLQTLPPLWLTTFFDLNIKKLINLTDDDFNIKVNIGPAEINKFDRILSKFKFNEKVMHLNVTKTDESYHFSLEAKNGTLFYEDISEINSESFDDTIIKMLAYSSLKSSQHKTGIEYLVFGLYSLSRFFSSPFNVKHVDKAIIYFKNSNIWPRLKILSDILQVTALQISQTKPSEAHRLAEALKQNNNLSAKQKDIVKYQYALTEFYRYKKEGYQIAIKEFKTFKQPNFYTRLISLIGISKFKRKLLLYLLSQTNLAIVYAHERDIIETNKELQKNKITQLHEALFKLLKKPSYKNLGTVINDVYWRIINAKIAFAYNARTKDENAIFLAEQALAIAPYALDVKANLGTLYLLDLVFSPEKKEILLEKSLKIFNELVKTGWDLGYVYYRLAQIHRIKNDFEKAMEFIKLASNPELIDISERRLKKENDSIEENNNQITIEDI